MYRPAVQVLLVSEVSLGHVVSHSNDLLERNDDRFLQNDPVDILSAGWRGKGSAVSVVVFVRRKNRPKVQSLVNYFLLHSP